MCNYCRMAKHIGQDLWTIDGPNVEFTGVSMNTRMTIARLRDGSLWIHSPIALSDETKVVVEGLGGPIAALVALNQNYALAFSELQLLNKDGRQLLHLHKILSH